MSGRAVADSSSSSSLAEASAGITRKNRDGRSTTLSTETGNFYCRERFACGCGNCDGVCGPTDGCQCGGCSGLRVAYCGRKYTTDNGCRCGACNGVCGPHNGCPCPNCAQACVKITPPVRQLTIPGFGSYPLRLFHGTSAAAAAAIISEGSFQPSSGGLLGPGVYLALVDKAVGFAAHAHARHRGTGSVVLEVQVYVRHVKHIDGDDQNGSWIYEGYDACYTTHTSRSTKPEIVVRDPQSIHIVGVHEVHD